MSTLDWSSTIGFSIAIMSIVFILITVSQLFLLGRKMRSLSKLRTKNKKKKRKIFIEKKKAQEKRKKYGWSVVILVVFLFLGLFMGIYSDYYQKTSLDNEEKQNLIEGHYYLKQLDTLSEKKEFDDNEKLQNLIGRISIFQTIRPSYRLSEKNKVILSRYYFLLGQLGTNLSSTNAEELKTETAAKQLKTELEKIKKIEKDLFAVFKINTSNLNKGK